jgi:riboflavin synthase
MFTGLIDDVGTLASVATTDAGRELRVLCRYQDLAIGESVAVNGACLTVREQGSGWFVVAAVITTLGRTTVGNWREGTRVNLERALRVGDRLGGHLVQGHVDGVGRVQAVVRSGDALLVDVALPATLDELVVPYGSIAIDGVSLTVNAIPGHGTIQLSLIEHTLRATTLGSLTTGSEVHVEADIVGKYLQRIAAPYLGRPQAGIEAERFL